jgi:hypothetical protein
MAVARRQHRLDRTLTPEHKHTEDARVGRGHARAVGGHGRSQ